MLELGRVGLPLVLVRAIGLGIESGMGYSNEVTIGLGF